LRTSSRHDDERFETVVAFPMMIAVVVAQAGNVFGPIARESVPARGGVGIGV
jgi:hypothetical protein